MYKTFRQIITILDPRTRLHFLFLLIPMMVMTALEIVSIGLVIPVIQVLVMGKEDGALTTIILEFLPEAGAQNPAFWITGLFAAFFLVKNFLLLFLIYVVNRVVTYKTAIYARHLFGIYLMRPMTFHFHNNSAALLLNITTGVNRSLETVRLILLMALDLMMMIGAFSLLIIAEPTATLGAAGVLVVVGTVFYLISSPIFRYWGEVTLQLERDLIKWINQSFTGIRDVKLLHAQGYLNRIIRETTVRRAHFLCLSTTSIHIPRLLIETIVIIGFLGIVLILLSSEQSSANIVSTLGLFGMAALRLMPSMNRLLTSASEVRRSAAFIDQIYDAFKPGDQQAVSVLHEQEKTKPVPFNRNLELKEVSYTYPKADQHALKAFSLVINKGETVGFVGSSGAGKSTLMDIFLGLLEPRSGQLLIDGSDAYENIEGWQKNIGFVPQQVFVMDDTIRRNIAFAVDDGDISDPRIETVLKMTQLDAFVESLPDGLDTVLGEHGTRLSGGQRQRIAIARALYRDPGVLVFDEATSALDNVTEREISHAIETLSGDKTILIVAHRLSTVRKCDRIIFMKEGRIEDTGTYDQLLEKNHDFRHLAHVGNISQEAEATSEDSQ